MMKFKYNPNKGKVKITMSEEAAYVLYRVLKDSSPTRRKTKYKDLPINGNNDISLLGLKLCEIFEPK